MWEAVRQGCRPVIHVSLDPLDSPASLTSETQAAVILKTVWDLGMCSAFPLAKKYARDGLMEIDFAKSGGKKPFASGVIFFPPDSLSSDYCAVLSLGTRSMTSHSPPWSKVGLEGYGLWL